MIDRYNTKNPTVGTLYLTATHLIFVEPDSNKETWVCITHFMIILKQQKKNVYIKIQFVYNCTYSISIATTY